MKTYMIVSSSFLLALAALLPSTAHAQPTLPKPRADISGTIYVKNISGNIGSQLMCNQIIVRPFYPTKNHYIGGDPAFGDITSGKCSYSTPVIPNSLVTLQILTPELFKKCDSVTFLTSRPTALKVALNTERIVNLTVRQASCTQVK